MLGPYRDGARARAICSRRSACRRPSAGTGIAHRKLAFRERPAATVAVWVRVAEGSVAEARIAVGSVGPLAVRATVAESLLLGGAAADDVAAAAAEASGAVGTRTARWSTSTSWCACWSAAHSPRRASGRLAAPCGRAASHAPWRPPSSARASSPRASERCLGAGPAHGPRAGRPLRPGPSRPATYRHVIWIWMENHRYDEIIGSNEAPFTNQLAAACGLATNFHNITHPSLPNYIAATSGGTQGISDDCQPSECSRRVQSLFGQLQAAGMTWMAYDESMPAAVHPEQRLGDEPAGELRTQAQPGRLLPPVATRLSPARRAAGHAVGGRIRARPQDAARSRASASSRRTSATTRTTAPSPRATRGSHAGCRRSSRAPPTAASGRPSSSRGTRARAEAPTTAPPTRATAAATSRRSS